MGEVFQPRFNVGSKITAERWELRFLPALVLTEAMLLTIKGTDSAG